MFLIIQGKIIKKGTEYLYVKEEETKNVYQVETYEKVSKYTVGDIVTLNCELYKVNIKNNYGSTVSAYKIKETLDRGSLKLNDKTILLGQNLKGDYPFIDLEVKDEDSASVRIEYDTYEGKYRSLTWFKDKDEPVIHYLGF